MNSEKKEFTKAEVEVIKFEKTDVIATSGGDKTQTISGTGQGLLGEIEIP